MIKAARLLNLFQIVYRSIIIGAQRFYFDDGFSRAAALAYSSLLALVPLTAMTVQLLSSVNIGQAKAMDAIRGILERMLPPGENEIVLDLQNQIFSVLESLGSNVKDLNSVTIIILIVTTVALFNTIQSAIDYVWRVHSGSGIFQRIIAHWTVFTAWLLLIAVSVYWTGQFGGMADDYLIFKDIPWIDFRQIFPILLTWFTLSVLYAKVPAASVRFKDAMLGGAVSAILFELLKRGFAYYVGRSTTYSALYGILAAIPLFLFWLYLIWVVVLLGAHITYQAGSLKMMGGLRRYATDLGEIGSLLGLRILQIIAERFIDGEEPPTEGELAAETSSDPVLVRSCLDLLTESRILTLPNPERHSRTLVKTPRKTKVSDILKTFRSKASRSVSLEKEYHENHTLSSFSKVSRKRKKDLGKLSLEEFVTLAR